MRRLALLLALTTLTATAAEENFPGVKQLMSDEEFREAGLHRLSEGERAALDRWLLGYTVGDAQELRRSNETVREAEEAVRIEASIKPPFRGWDGDTVFALDNGQVWRQRLRGRYFHRGDDTSVVISKNLFGFWEMTMTSSGKSVGVTRVK